MPWSDKVSSIIVSFMPGQEFGNAIASILFGDTNPSGKLPLTFPISQNDIPVNTTDRYPGYNNEASYSEKLLVGYRWYDALNKQTLFPFGHGLSYTTFDYGNVSVSGSIYSSLRVSFDLKNSGQRRGSEVAQLYVGFPSNSGEPPKQLKRFTKISLAPNEVKKISFYLDETSASIWDTSKHDWVIVAGTYNIYIGSSSRDIRQKTSFTA